DSPRPTRRSRDSTPCPSAHAEERRREGVVDRPLKAGPLALFRDGLHPHPFIAPSDDDDRLVRQQRWARNLDSSDPNSPCRAMKSEGRDVLRFLDVHDRLGSIGGLNLGALVVPAQPEDLEPAATVVL